MEIDVDFKFFNWQLTLIEIFRFDPSLRICSWSNTALALTVLCIQPDELNEQKNNFFMK